MLEAGVFKELQSLMLKKQMERNSFFKFEVNPPKFEGDTWKAFYFANASKEVLKGGMTSGN